MLSRRHSKFYGATAGASEESQSGCRRAGQGGCNLLCAGGLCVSLPRLSQVLKLMQDDLLKVKEEIVHRGASSSSGEN